MKKTTIIAFLLVACMATMCFVGGTFAKYTSTAIGKDSVRVAKWDVSAMGLEDDPFEAEAVVVNLFQAYVDAHVDVDGPDGDEIVIAPGTTGEISFDLANSSEVLAEYKVVYAADEATVPLQWSLDGSDWKDDITALNVEDFTEIDMLTGEATVTLQWKWAFEDDAIVEQSDAGDTTLGLAGTAAPTVTISVIFQQVD